MYKPLLATFGKTHTCNERKGGPRPSFARRPGPFDSAQGKLRPGPTRKVIFLVPIIVAMVAIVGMSVAPVPVGGLLAPVGSGIFVRLAVIFREVSVPGAILVVVPVVIVLVLFVVDAILAVVVVLRRGCGDQG
jgi:hypothetical protein